MAEEVKIEEQQVEVAPPKIDPFDEKSWSDSPISNEEKKEEIKEEAKEIVVEEKKDEQKEEIFDEDVFVKNKFGFDTVEAAQAAIAELKSKAETPSEIKFADEQSKHIHELLKAGKKKEVREFLDTQEKLDSYLSADVTKETAENIIKLSIQLKNKELTKEEVDFEYKQNYTLPKEPVQKASETDEDFEERKAEWNEKADAIETRRIIAAKMAKPELEKLKSEITLPDIKKEVDSKVTQEAQQKELERVEGLRNQFLKVLESDYSKFNGYEVKAKDGEVEIPVSYVISDQQKLALKDELKNFDVDGFIETRWFNKDGSPNISQMMEDIHLLRNKGDVFQKIANDAASKRLVQHLGDKSKVDVNGKSPNGTFKPDGNQTDQQKMAEFFWNQS